MVGGVSDGRRGKDEFSGVDDSRRTRVKAWAKSGGIGWRVAFGVLLVLVVTGSVLPPSDEPSAIFLIPDWVQHAIGYGLLMATLLASQARPRIGMSALALVALGGVLEVVQGLIGYRYAELKDLLANGAGIAAVALVVRIVQDRTGERKEQLH